MASAQALAFQAEAYSSLRTHTGQAGLGGGARIDSSQFPISQVFWPRPRLVRLRPPRLSDPESESGRPCASQEGGSMLLRREGGFLRRAGGFLRRGGGS